ncbi:hypothetical protein RhiirC2_866853 [Rhizophagus irregularis]|uniref:Uncharacterized protein n=1 Tax=Rhizophagus irregularis TaxID=588596 RepID=A0A2N1N5R1_9GLOM|nr:hypothetical protein RhiirC2_866853 [Rhizophagus irregularis]
MSYPGIHIFAGAVRSEAQLINFGAAVLPKMGFRVWFLFLLKETSFEVRTWIAFQNFLKLQQEVVIHNNIIRLYGIMKDESVVGIPVVNLQDQIFSIDGSAVPTRPKCTDPNNAKYKSSTCATRKSVRVSCESFSQPGTPVDTNFSCGDGDSCVNITPNDAFCVDDSSAQVWDNKNENKVVCSAPVSLVPPHVSFQLVAGITTYSTTGDPIRVAELQAKYDDNNSNIYTDYKYQENNYTFPIKQEDFSTKLSFCFYPGSNEEVQAVGSLAYVLM